MLSSPRVVVAAWLLLIAGNLRDTQAFVVAPPILFLSSSSSAGGIYSSSSSSSMTGAFSGDYAPGLVGAGAEAAGTTTGVHLSNRSRKRQRCGITSLASSSSLNMAAVSADTAVAAGEVDTIIVNSAIDEEDNNIDSDDDDDTPQRIITIQPSALKHLLFLKEKEGKGEEICVRMGVRSGGCSGLSYVMDLIQEADVTEDDMIEAYPEHGFKCAIDPKSLLYLYGLELDYSDALIGGGFQFQNPQATSSCGCGKSFGI